MDSPNNARRPLKKSNPEGGEIERVHPQQNKPAPQEPQQNNENNNHTTAEEVITFENDIEWIKEEKFTLEQLRIINKHCTELKKDNTSDLTIEIEKKTYQLPPEKEDLESLKVTLSKEIERVRQNERNKDPDYRKAINQAKRDRRANMTEEQIEARNEAQRDRREKKRMKKLDDVASKATDESASLAGDSREEGNNNDQSGIVSIDKLGQAGSLENTPQDPNDSTNRPVVGTFIANLVAGRNTDQQQDLDNSTNRAAGVSFTRSLVGRAYTDNQQQILESEEDDKKPAARKGPPSQSR
jgi:hypothetical protein